MCSKRGAAVCAVLVAVVLGGGKWLTTCPPFKIHENGQTIVEKVGPAMPIGALLDAVLRPFVDSLFPLDREVLMTTAKENTGLDDFGDFLVPNEVIDRIFADQTERKFLGRFLFNRLQIDIFASHLRLTQLLKDHPEILRQPIDRPVIITGMARSGTTFMHQLLAGTNAADEGVKHLKFWEVLSDPLESDQAKRRTTAETIWKQIMTTAPTWNLVHEVPNIDFPEEETMWTKSVQPGLASYVGGSAKGDVWQLDDGHKRETGLMRMRLLKILLQFQQWRDGRRYRWILKSPEHLLSLPELGEVFPDVKLIVNYREPVPVLKSHYVLVNSFAQIAGLPPSDSSFIHYYFCKQWNVLQGLHQVFEYPFKSTSPVERLDLDFDYLVKNPKDAVKLSQEFAGLPWSAGTMMAAEGAIKKHAEARPAKYFYNLTEYGVNGAGLPVLVAQCSTWLSD